MLVCVSRMLNRLHIPACRDITAPLHRTSLRMLKGRVCTDDVRLPRSSMASSSSSISSSATDGTGLWTESKESWDNMAARSFLWCCCCSFSPLLFVSIFRLEAAKKAQQLDINTDRILPQCHFKHVICGRSFSLTFTTWVLERLMSTAHVVSSLKTSSGNYTLSHNLPAGSGQSANMLHLPQSGTHSKGFYTIISHSVQLAVRG